PGKVGPEGLDVAGTLDVIADHPRFVHVEDHEIAALRIFHDLARRGLGLLVIVLAVDEGGITVPGVALDPLPHVQHRSTGSVDQHAADAAKPLEVANGDAERRHDHDVVWADLGEVELTLRFLGEEGNAHGTELLIDMGIVNDLADQKEPPVGKLGPAFVGVFHCAVHAVAEAELPGQPKGEMPRSKSVAVVLERIDHGTVVVSRQPTGDFALEAESFAEVGLLHAVNVHWSLEVLDPCRTPDRGPHSRKQRASPPGLENCLRVGFAGYQPPPGPGPRTGRTTRPCWTAPGSRFRCRPETPAPPFVPATAPQCQLRAEATRPWAGQPLDMFPPPRLVQDKAPARRRCPPEPHEFRVIGEARTT